MLEKLRPWLPLIGLVLFAGVVAWKFNQGERAQDERARLAEARELELKGQLVSAQESAKTEKAKAADLLKGNAELQKLYDTALAAAPGARPTGVADLSTGAAAAQGQAPTTPPTTPCLLAEGDDARIDTALIELGTEGKNHVIVATSKVVRLRPAPEAVILAGSVKRELSAVSEVAPPSEKAWGAGLAAVCDWGRGCGLGPAADVSFKVLGLTTQLHGAVTLEKEPKLSVALTFKF